MKDSNRPNYVNAVRISYTNYKGETSERTIVPMKIWYGNNSFHPEIQWFLDAFDVEKNAERSFAMKDILKWDSLKEQQE